MVKVRSIKRHSLVAYATGITVGALTLIGLSGTVPANSAQEVGPPQGAAVTFGSPRAPEQSLHVFYYDNTNGNLRHAFQVGAGQWQFETLDGNSTVGGRLDADVGRGATAVVYNNDLDVFYYDATHGDLREAVLHNGSWRFKTIDGDSSTGGRLNVNLGRSPAEYVYNGQLNVFYYDLTDGDLRHAWLVGKRWGYETLDGNSTVGGRLNDDLGRSPVADSFNGQLHVFYYDYSDGDLRHAWLDSGGWHFETLDGNSTLGGRINGDVGQTPTTVIYNGTLHVYYYDFTHGDLRHAFFKRQWHFQTLDGNTFDGGRLNADLGNSPDGVDFNGDEHLVYYDFTDGDLRHAWWSGSWTFQTMDGNSNSGGRVNGDVGQASSLAVYNGLLQVFYYNFSHGDLRHAWSSDGSSWGYETLDGNSFVGGRIKADIGATVHAVVY